MYGLIEDIQEFTAYVLGKSRVPYVPYNESGDWEAWLPKYENQTTRLGQETSGCTVWGSLNQLETLYKFLYNEEPNYSERFTYLNVPVTPARGTDPQNTYEAIRKHGLVDERDLPMTDTLAEYLDASDITGSMRAKGQYWLKRHDYQHEWLWKNAGSRPANYIEILKDALTTSPIAISVSAWNLQVDEQGNEVYVSYGDVNNHLCVLWKFDDEGYPWAYDSYDHSKKRLSKDHNIRRAKRIWLNKRTPRAMRRQVSLLTAIVNLLVKKVFMHPLQKAYPVSQKFLVPSTEYESGVHNGTDYACPMGTPIIAPSDGEIIHVFRDHKTMGNAVYFSCDDEKHYIRFMHLSSMSPRGSYKQGDIIGKTGSTGKSTGPHLHVDVWKIPFNTALIKTEQGVRDYMVDPEEFFRHI